MQQDRYPVTTGPASKVFEFVSEGPKGRIRKVVVFSTTNLKDLFNLGFGDVDPITGALSDDIVTNNGDRKKVLATVAGIVHDFLQEYPDAIVFVTGNTTASKTRLYQMDVANNIDVITEVTEVFGLINNQLESFRKGPVYDGFYARLKS